ncbi:MAG: hypothetical protein JXQ71_05660 [Verrucomicrobia bacterium]|nr:hypothetical protein [Verrucomicrobiota bacterium]
MPTEFHNHAPPKAETPPVVTLVYDGQESPAPKRAPWVRRYPRSRLVGALAVAGVSDLLSLGFTLVPPVQWGVDLATALVLFAVLGGRWMLLPALILEAIPGLSALPVWTLVVISIASYGAVRPDVATPAGRQPS